MPRNARAPISLLLLARQFSAGPFTGSRALLPEQATSRRSNRHAHRSNRKQLNAHSAMRVALTCQ